MIAAAALAVATTITIAAALLAIYTSAAVDTLPEDAPTSACVIWWHGRAFTTLGLLVADLAIVGLILWGLGRVAMLAAGIR